MKRDLMDILACPLCKQPFELEVEKEEGDEVVSGWLTRSECPFPDKCDGRYRIEDTIPNLLPKDLQ